MQPQTVAQQMARFWIKENAIIVDTETTGLTETDQIVEIALLECDGTELLNTLVKPSCPVNPEAAAIHGISASSLHFAPTAREVMPDVIRLLADRTVVAYNAPFDVRLIRQTCEANGINAPHLNGHCAMREYAKYFGEWCERRAGYRWQNLTKAARQQGIPVPANAHRAMDDCRTTRQLIHIMAFGRQEVA